jgi:hypothetical protein
MADFRETAMNRGTKNTPVHVHHEPGSSKELTENLVEIRALSNVPQGLGMVHRDYTVRLQWPPIPGRAIPKVGAHEGRYLTCRIAGEVLRDHISYHHITFRLELPAVMIVDPLTV